ncbi:MAG TPA: nitrate reductase associated protein [Thermosynechococcaceae cyanobacterium]
MGQFFQFESDFVESLRCVPMQVRYKLDTCGVKLKLAQWNQFTQDDRQVLVHLPCEADQEVQQYRQMLHQMIVDRTGTTATSLEIDPAPSWLNSAELPESVQQKAKEIGQTISLAQWRKLTPLQRFALIKLSRSSHENHNFLPALEEFHLKQ